MRYGVSLGSDPTTSAREAQLLESRGFDTAWFPEVPFLNYGDPYVCMALAAQETERIRLGTFIAPAGLRPPSMHLTQYGTVNRIAPGRVRIGWASGSISRSLLARPPLKVRELREELVILRSLLDHRTAEIDGTTLALGNWDRPTVDLDGIPLEVAAGGPRTAALAGELGDGLITAGIVEPDALGSLRAAAIAAATEAGRSTEDFPFTVELAIPSVQRPGEEIDSPRMLSMLQPLISMNYAVYIMAGTDPDELAPEMRDAYAGFRQWAHERYGEDARVVHRRVSEKLIGRIPEHDPFITPGAIRGVTLAGPLEEVIERLRNIQSAGATDLAFTVAVDRPLSTSGELEDLTTLAEAVG